MLVDARRISVPELAAKAELFQVRTPELRVGWFRCENLATDFGLVNGAVPFVHRFRRSGLTVVLEGEGRFEEAGRRRFFPAGSVVQNDQNRGGTEAYAGPISSYLVVEWTPGASGRPFDGAFSIDPLPARDLARLAAAGRALGGDAPLAALTEVSSILASLGLPMDKVDPRAIKDEELALQQLERAVSTHLGSLETHPTVEDVATVLGWNQRQVHRRMTTLAERYQLSWQHWRDAVHQARITHALRLLSAPRATTELVARLSGFRSPNALCHAFADAGLPSPGRVAQAARHEVLARWSGFVDAMTVTHADLGPPSNRAA